MWGLRGFGGADRCAAAERHTARYGLDYQETVVKAVLTAFKSPTA